MSVVVPDGLEPGVATITVSSTIAESTLTSPEAIFFVDAVFFDVRLPDIIFPNAPFTMTVTARDPEGERVSDFDDIVFFKLLT